ncbi:MarR family winged helix-turn-helix transcriptional regulator [Actinoplanes sp. CA-142083]|uniref:MarR family winged helix-turn-helix transcriptional regulator n=1 Tax=Actinoplanes sp. CA-142083 TaxID=3239903 RepID=UPI003D8A707D
MTNTTTPPHDDDVPWLGDDERGAWMTLISLLMSLPTAIDAQLKRDSGLNFFEYSILSALSRRPGRAVRMNTLALYAGGSASRLSHAVTRLEKQGWVRREVHNSEIRCTEAMLTEKGLAVLEAAAPGHVREARRLVFDSITPEQVGHLQLICRQLVGSTSPELAAALDQAIVEAAAEGGAADGAAEFDRAILEQTAASPCTAALEEAVVGHAAASPCTAALEEAVGQVLDEAAASPRVGSHD